MGHASVLREHGSYLVQQATGTKVWMTREGNRDTLNFVCWHRVDNLHTVNLTDVQTRAGTRAT